MESDTLLTQAFIYLAAAIVAVPLAKRAGFGSVLGYLLAGVLIGPSGFGFLGHAGAVQHVAEFGVVIMLFLIGLELQLDLLWTLRRAILGLGSAQVLATAAVIAVAGVAFGYSWQMALAAGLILSLSSTAIVMQSLREKGITAAPAGRTAFSVLLLQDIAVIPMLAFLPLLGTDPQGAAAHRPVTPLTSLPEWGAVRPFGQNKGRTRQL